MGYQPEHWTPPVVPPSTGNVPGNNDPGANHPNILDMVEGFDREFMTVHRFPSGYDQAEGPPTPPLSNQPMK